MILKAVILVILAGEVRTFEVCGNVEALLLYTIGHSRISMIETGIVKIIINPELRQLMVRVRIVAIGNLCTVIQRLVRLQVTTIHNILKRCPIGILEIRETRMIHGRSTHLVEPRYVRVKVVGLVVIIRNCMIRIRKCP